MADGDGRAARSTLAEVNAAFTCAQCGKSLPLHGALGMWCDARCLRAANEVQRKAYWLAVERNEAGDEDGPSDRDIYREEAPYGSEQ